MESIKTIKICKRNKIAKDKADLKFRSYIDDDIKYLETLLPDINKIYKKKYIDAEDDAILKGL